MQFQPIKLSKDCRLTSMLHTLLKLSPPCPLYCPTQSVCPDWGESNFKNAVGRLFLLCMLFIMHNYVRAGQFIGDDNVQEVGVLPGVGHSIVFEQLSNIQKK